MKKMITYSFILLLSACAEQKQLSPIETAKVVVESFYQKDNATLEKHTTTEGYNGLIKEGGQWKVTQKALREKGPF